MFKRRKPDNGYCFFFPGRPKGRRFVAGRTVSVGMFEEWKHVRLGQFGVRIHTTTSGVANTSTAERKNPTSGEPPLIATLDNFKCAIEGDFKIVVGGAGSDLEIEERIHLCTRTCPPTRDVANKIGFDFFEPWARNYCNNSITQVIGGHVFLDLLTSDELAAIVQEIRSHLTSNLAKIGLLLVESTIIITPLEPPTERATTDILAKWNKLLLLRQQIEEQKLNQENGHKRTMQAETDNHLRISEEKRCDQVLALETIKTRNIAELADLKRNNEIANQEAERKKAERITELKTEIDKINESLKIAQHTLSEEASKRDHAKKCQDEAYQHELEEKAATNAATREQAQSAHKHHMALDDEMHKLTIQQKEQERTELSKTQTLKVIGIDEQVANKRLEFFDAYEKLENAELDRRQRAGTIEASTRQALVLADAAAQIQIQQQMVQSLPQVLAAISAPIGKIGDLRVLCVPGGTDAAAATSGIGGILAASTALPLFKEAIDLVRDFVRADSSAVEHGPSRPNDGESGFHDAANSSGRYGHR